MSRVPSLSSPFLLGFDEIERALDRVSKAADGYPPYNIERLPRDGGNPERLRITLAVAGFTRDQLDVSIEVSAKIVLRNAIPQVQRVRFASHRRLNQLNRIVKPTNHLSGFIGAAIGSACARACCSKMSCERSGRTMAKRA